MEKFSETLANAQVDINPHQIEAALFAFRSPLSKWAILADEVWLWKTIEAGIVMAQKWAEKKQKILLIVPANLRKQWTLELSEKFFLPSLIMEKKSFNEIIKSWNLNPFNQDWVIVVTSYQFASSKWPYLSQVPWDLVVIDEAHRLRNVYKTWNKTARSIKDAVINAPKILLTATPLQNSLLELFGLVSIIDEHVFWDLKSFKAKYSRVAKEQSIDQSDIYSDGLISGNRSSGEMFLELRDRLAPICNRTLRRQVLEYIKYTKRIPLTQDYYPDEVENLLYEKVTEYLQTPKLYALPASQRQLITLILRRLLSSSSFAIAKTLGWLIERIEWYIREAKSQISSRWENIDMDSLLVSEYENYENIRDDWIDDEEWDDDEASEKEKIWMPEDIVFLERELHMLEEARELAISVDKNSKWEALLQALSQGFEKTSEIGSNKKALIFTESMVTQGYIKNLLEENWYKWQVIVFNGTNTDPESQAIYTKWLTDNKDSDRVTWSKTADMRSAIVDKFKNEAEIMIATEAGAEGINLQFCSLLINYDLPWNPQRIEQRIGRCHRYWQKHDVVVINFLNRRNAADQRVFELLDQKFNLFKWVFWASDEVLGVIESWVDFEKRIAKIYQECRTADEINASFDALQKEMDEKIQENMTDTRQKLLENFDEDVRERLKANKERSEQSLDNYDRALWELTVHFLGGHANYAKDEYSFTLHDNPFPWEHIPPGPYKMGKNVEDVHLYRPRHPLAKRIIEEVKKYELEPVEIVFDYSNYGSKISSIESLVGKNGYMKISRITVSALDTEDEILCSGILDDGTQIDPDALLKIWKLPWEAIRDISINTEIENKLETISNALETNFLLTIDTRNSDFFDEEIGKLEKWTDDMKTSLEIELKQLDIEISTLKTQSRKLIQLEEKLEAQRKLKDLEKKRSDMRRNLYEMQDEIDGKKEELLSGVEARLKRKLEKEEILIIKFQVI